MLLTMKQNNNNKIQYIMQCKNYSKTKTITFPSIKPPHFNLIGSSSHLSTT